jgi:glycosyltransferase involved in cell wall biosynthesis
MFSNLFPPVVSGSATQCAALSHELVKRGCKVVVITAKLTDESQEYEVVKDVHVYRLPAFRLPKLPVSLNFPWLNVTFTMKNQSRIREILDHHRPDIIHLHNHMFDMAFSAVKEANRLKKPLVVTIHTVVKHPILIYNILLYPADRWFLKHFVIDQADVLLCPDLTIERYVVDVFQKKNITILPYGINEAAKPDEGMVGEIRSKYDLKEGPIILSLGHLHEIRNRKELIEAMPEVLKRFPSAKLLIVGDVGTDTAETLAYKLGVRESVIFTGAVPHSQVPAYFEIADIEAHWFDQSNLQNKTLGIAALEAMGAGKAVVGTADEDVYGKGVLRNGENVIIVDLQYPSSIAETINEILADADKRRLIGGRARQTIIDHFSWDSICNRTLKVYEEAIRNNKRF